MALRQYFNNLRKHPILDNLAGKRFGQDVLWNLGSLVILAVGGIGINIIIARYQGLTALGIFTQVYAIYIVLSQIGVGGLQFSVLRYSSYNQNDADQCNNIAISALILVGLLSGVICIITYAFADVAGAILKSPGVSIGLKLVVPGLYLFALNKVLINVLNGLRHMKAFAVFRSLRFVLIPTIIVLTIIADLPAPYMLLSLTITEIVLFFCLIIYINARIFRFRISSGLKQWFPIHASFGIRGMLSGVLIELNTSVDILMLGYFSTDSIVGIYSFAVKLAEGFGQIPLALRWNVDPIIGKYFAENEIDKISQLSKNIRRVFQPLIGLLGLFAIIIFPFFSTAWLQDNAAIVSAIVFAIVMVGIIINAGYRPFTGILMQGGRPGVNTLLIGGLVLGDALLNLYFIPAFEIYGAALVTSLTYTMEAILLIILSRKLFNVRL